MRERAYRTSPDPRVIFALLFLSSSLAVLIRDDVLAMAGLMVIVFSCTLLLRVSMGSLLRRSKRLLQILLFITVLRSVFAPAGLVLLAAGNLPILTTGGLAMGIMVSLRLIIFIIGASMLTVYSARSLIQGLVQIKMPYEIAYMVSIGIRFVPLLAEELKDSLTALQLRGVVIEELKFKKRLSLYTYLLLPVIVGSLRQAKELSMSMEMRAFRAMERRSSYYRLKFDISDMVLLFAVVFAAAGLGYLVVNNNFYLLSMEGFYQ